MLVAERVEAGADLEDHRQFRLTLVEGVLAAQVLHGHAQLQVADTDAVHDTEIQRARIHGGLGQAHVQVVDR